LFEKGFGDSRIRIQQDDIGRPALSQEFINGPCKPDIFSAFGIMDAWIKIDYLIRVINGCIIVYKNINRKISFRFEYRFQATHQEGRTVIIDNNNIEYGLFASGPESRCSPSV
jgi:hypothetical protein